MDIDYTDAPLPGEHNDGRIGCRWTILDGARTVVSGWRPDRPSAEAAVKSQLESMQTSGSGGFEPAEIDSALKNMRSRSACRRGARRSNAGGGRACFEPAVLDRNWGGSPPDWVQCLAGQCRERGLDSVAVLLNVTPQAVRGILTAKYRRSKCEASVRRLFMSGSDAWRESASRGGIHGAVTRGRRRRDYLAVVRNAWREPPDWVLLLARHCNEHPVHEVAAELGVAPTTLSNALNAHCTPRPGAGMVERRVRERLMNDAEEVA